MREPEALPSRSLEDILVIDPACGDGEFLSAAVDLVSVSLVHMAERRLAQLLWPEVKDSALPKGSLGG